MENSLVSISVIMKNGWKLYLDNFQKFLNPILIMIAPYVLLFIVQYFEVPAMGILSFILSIVSIIVNLWIAVLLILLINGIYKKQTIDFNKLYENSFKKIVSYLWVGILTGIITLIGFILLIIPGIILAIWYAFSLYDNVLENKKGMAALKSSKELVKGRWGKTFLRLIIPALLVYVIVMIVIIAIMYMVTSGQIDLLSYQQIILFNALSTIIFLILAPLFVTFSIILYKSLKQARPGMSDSK